MTSLLYALWGLFLAPVYQQAPRPKLDVPPNAQVASMPPGRPQVVGSLSFTGGELLAWDMLTFYAPGLFWKGTPPEPTMWMQNRGLPIGAKFDAAALKIELQKWSR